MKKTKFFALLLALLMLMSSITFTVSADIESTREALQQKIEQAQNSYPPPGSNPLSGTVAALSDAIDEALKVLADSNATEEELNAQIALLDEAINGIVILDLDNSKLWEAMQLANSLNENDYTEESYEAMKMLANDYLVLHYAQSQAEIDEATNNIYLAILSLVPVGTATVPYIDEEIFSSGYQRFLDALKEAEEQFLTVGGNYNIETYRLFVETYEKALAIYESGEELTNDGYNILAEELEAAIAGIEYFDWDTDELWEVIQSCDAIYDDIGAGKYFYDTYLENFQAAHGNATPALYYAQSQEEVDNAAKALKEAIRRLIPQDDVKGELQDEIKYTEEEILANKDLYTEDSLATVSAMYENAKNTLAENPQDAVMMQAIYDLRDAQDQLTPATESTSAVITTEATEVVTTTALVTDPAEVTTAPETTVATEPVETTTATEATETTEATKATEITETTKATETATTTASTTQAVIPTVKPAPNYIIGDADSNSKINIKDATEIQKHLAKLITLSDSAILAGDANEDGKLNVKDATEIQKHLANLPSNSHIGMEIVTPDTTPVDTTVIPCTSETVPDTTTDVATKDEETTVATEPETTVVTEPFNTTEAATSVTDATEVTEATEATTETATATEEVTTEEITTIGTTTEVIESEPITIFFRDQYNWGNIHIYYWSENEQFHQWPGVAMEPVHEDAEGIIYKAEIPAQATGIVFNSQAVEETHQTKDIHNFKNGDGFYPTVLEDNNWDVAPLFYGNDVSIDFTTVTNQRMWDGYGISDDGLGYYAYIVKSDSDKKYESLFKCEVPEIDTADLAKRNKAAIVIFTCLSSGSDTIKIDKLTVSSKNIFVNATITSPDFRTDDMNYRCIVIEADREYLENVTDCWFSTFHDFNTNIPKPPK